MKKEKIKGLVGTFVLHLILLVLLLFFVIERPQVQEEGGVPVMLGNSEMAQGDADPYTLTEVEVSNEPIAKAVPAPNSSGEDNIITQSDEKSIEIKKQKSDKKEEKKVATDKTKSVTKEKSEEQKRIDAEREAEAKRIAKEEMAAKQASASIAGAFGKGTKMGSRGTGSSGTGFQGSPNGNSDTGKSSGIGGIGTFDLNGRSLGPSGLPMPEYNVQDEGRVVVTIVVNPAGQVISTTINKRTNTVNPTLRKAAEDAARKARFNNIDGTNNQSGTITYYFKLR